MAPVHWCYKPWARNRGTSSLRLACLWTHLCTLGSKESKKKLVTTYPPSSSSVLTLRSFLIIFNTTQINAKGQKSNLTGCSLVQNWLNESEAGVTEWLYSTSKWAEWTPTSNTHLAHLGTRQTLSVGNEIWDF